MKRRFRVSGEVETAGFGIVDLDVRWPVRFRGRPTVQFSCSWNVKSVSVARWLRDWRGRYVGVRLTIVADGDGQVSWSADGDAKKATVSQ